MILNSDINTMKVLDEKKVIISNELADKIKNKQYLVQFLPSIFDEFKDKKHIIYKSEKLKTDYLIDIISNLILKYYFKKENKFIINASILKDKYGYLYNYYINYLIDRNILILRTNYKKGVSSRIYSVSESIFKSKISRYKNSDNVLLKKYKKKIFDTICLSDDEVNHINIDIKQKLISDLFNVDIDMSRSIFFLDSLKNKDIDVYNRNLYSVDSIKNKHIFYHFDNYGRLHSNFTILRSFIRKNCLLIDGCETYEIDIKNSQPLFLFKLIKDSNTKWVDITELELFEILVKNGNFYQYLIDNLLLRDRNEAKNMTYKVFFGKNYKSCKYTKMFGQLFPTILNYIKLYKKEMGDYKSLAYSLQREESNFLFNTFIKKIMLINNDIKIVTVHDSVIVDIKYRDFISNIFKKELYKYLS
jgi:hypothetical protein